MRIRELELHNFRSYDHLKLAFDQPRTLIVGENGAGKSTIIDAIALALTGQCRGVNARGEGQKELIRTGASEAKITLTIDGLPPIVRTISDKHGTNLDRPIDMVLGQLGTTKGMATAVVYGGSFFDLHHAEAKALLMDLLNVKVAVPVRQGNPAGSDDGTELIDLPEVDRRYKLAFDERASLKRSLQALAVPDVQRRTDLERIDQDNLTNQLRDARTRYEAIVATSADVRADAKQLDDEAQDLKKGQTIDLLTLRGKVVTHQETLKKHEQEAAGARADLAKAEAKPAEATSTLGAQVNELKLFMQRVEGHAGDAKVPAECVLGKGIPCLTPAGEFTKALADTKKEIAALEKRIKAGTKRAEAIAAANQAIRSADQNVTYHQGQVTNLTEKIKAVEAGATRLIEIAADLAELNPALTGAADQIEAAAGDLAKLQTIEKELAVYQAQLKARTTAQERQAALKQDVDDAEAQVKLFGPTGARATALQDAVDDFHQAINAALAVFGFELAINVDPWRVLVVTPNTSGPLRFDLLSKGQRIWTGLAFQLALAAISGLDFCVVDDAEGVVGAAMSKLTGLVMAAPVGQVLIVKAQADSIDLPKFDGLQALRVLPAQAGLPAGVGQ